MFSYHYNKSELGLGDDALVIASGNQPRLTRGFCGIYLCREFSGFQSTHVMPIVGGVLDVKNCQRINLGGYNNGAYLQRLLQLRFPKLSPVFTLTRYVRPVIIWWCQQRGP